MIAALDVKKKPALALALPILVLLIGCVDTAESKPNNHAITDRSGSGEEHTMSKRSGSRPQPPAVPPVAIGNVQYQQVFNGANLGLPEGSGYVSAVDAETSERLWTIRVYEVPVDEGREADVQQVYFTSMSAINDGAVLEIANERGETYHVDLASRSSARAR